MVFVPIFPDLKIGICGEHGGQPQAVEFCHRIGLNYVSCSPMRIPIARMAAAHAAIRTRRAGRYGPSRCKALRKHGGRGQGPRPLPLPPSHK